MKKQLIIILIFCISALWNQTMGQQATTTIVPKSFLIGDQALLTLQVKTKKGQAINWPMLMDSTATYKIDIIEKGVVDTLKSDTSKWITYTQKLKITSFDTGSIVIPAIEYYGSDSTLIAVADSMSFHVTTIPVDTSKAFMDIKGTFDEQLRFSEIIPWVLLVVGILIVIIIGIILFIRHKKKKPLFALMKAKTVLPHEYALAALKSLQEKRLWQDGHVKRYYSELTEILRIYITNRYAIDAMEMLSSEIINWMATNPETYNERSKMNDLFSTSDLVKFAKSMPLPNENDLYMNYAIDFVNVTTPVVIAEAKKEKNPDSTSNNIEL
jgi:hypothetical protein